MSDRTVSVILRARIADYQRAMRQAAGDTRAAATEMENADKSLGGLEQSSKKTSAEVDKLSGRLRLFRDIGVTIGPALIPLTAGALPALVGGIAGIGAGAAGIGTAALALQGLKDGLKALDAYKLDPTIENFQKLQQVEKSLGPVGAQFLHYIDSLEPRLKDLQNLARQGFLPGLEDGIDDLLTRLPDVRDLVGSVSTELGRLSRDAGSSLSGKDWNPFFNYLKSDAAPTLDEFARSAGNVALGLANMLTAFAPASRDFSGGLLDMTQRFADWSKTLDNNDSFQAFLSYIRTEGPQTVAFLGSLINLLTGVAKAAEPWGRVMLPALTQLSDLLGDVANSPAGPALFTAAAAMLAYSRATKIAGSAQAMFQSSWGKASFAQKAAGLGLLAVAATGYADKIGAANTVQDTLTGAMVGGPWGAAVGLVVGQYSDLSAAADKWQASLDAASDALLSGDVQAMQQQLAALTKQRDALTAHSGLELAGRFITNPAKFAADAKAYDQMTGRIDELKGALQEGGGVADLFGESVGQSGKAMSVAAGEADDLSGALAALNGWFDKRDAVLSYKDAIDALSKGLKNGFTRDDAKNLDAAGEGILQVANAIKSPVQRATFLASARGELVDLAQNAGPKAKAAIQEVIDKLDDKGLTHPPTPKVDVDASQADKKIADTKQKVKDLSREQAFPMFGADDAPFNRAAGSVKQQLAGVDNAKAAPTVGADVHLAVQSFGLVNGALARINAAHASSKVTADTGQAVSAINSVLHLLGLADGRVATTTIRTVHSTVYGPTQNPQAKADGGQILGPGGPRDDKILARLSNREYVMPVASVDHYGLSMMDAIRARRFADGGPVDNSGRSKPSTSKHHTTGSLLNITDLPFTTLTLTNQQLVAAIKALDKSLNRQLKAQEKALTKAQKQDDAAHSNLDTVTGQSNDLASTIMGTLGFDDIFTKTPASTNPWAAGATVGGKVDPTSALNKITDSSNQMVADIQALKKDGLGGPALAAILGQGPDITHQIASLPALQVLDYGQAYNAASTAAMSASSTGASAVYGDQIKSDEAIAAKADARAAKLEAEVKGLRQDVKAMDANNQVAQAQNSKDTTAGVNGAASKGHRSRVYASQ